MAKLLPNSEALRGALSLGAQGGDLFRESLDGMKNAAGATSDAFAGQIDPLDELAGSWQKLKETLGAALEEIATSLAPVIKGFTDFLAEVDFKALGISLGIVAGGFLAVKTAIAGVTVATRLLTGALAVNPIGAIALAATAAVTGLYFLVKNWDRVVVFISETAERLASRFRIIWSNISSAGKIAWEEIKSGVVSLSTGISKYLIDKLEAVTGALARIPGFKWAERANKKLSEWSDNLESAREASKQALERLKTEVEIEKNAVINAEKEKIAAIRKAAVARKKIAENIKKDAESARADPVDLELAGNTDHSAFITSLKSYVNSLWDASRNASASTGDLVENLAIARSIADSMSNSSLPGFDRAISGISTGAVTVAAVIKEDLASAWDSVSDSASRSWARISAVASAALSGISQAVSGFGQQFLTVQESNNKWAEYYSKKEMKAKKEALDEELSDRIAQLKEQGLSEAEYNEQKESLEKENKEKIKKLENELALENYKRQVEQFQIAKGLRIAETIMNGAAAALMAFAQLGPIAGAIAAGAIGGITIAKTALIAEQKPPPPPILAASGVREYMVPPGFLSDSFPVMAKSGESVTVSPFGETATPRQINVVVNIGGKRLANTIQALHDNGHIRVTA